MAEFYFQIETKYGRFSDAIWFPDDAPMSIDEIEAEKQRRVANWIAHIETPAETTEETTEEPVVPEEPLPEPEA
jgi:hypothetical protein